MANRRRGGLNPWDSDTGIRIVPYAPLSDRDLLGRARADLQPDRRVDALELALADALGAQPLVSVLVRPPAAHRADVAGRCPERDLQDGDVELVVVREDADRRALVHVRLGKEAVGPLDDELVDVREAIGRDELRARVADGDAEAEEAADRGERGGDLVPA